MAVMTKEIAWGDYNTEGVPGSGIKEPKKIEQRQYLGTLETMAASGAIMVATKAELDAITDKADNAPGWVVGDSTGSNNGIYAWDSGASTWTKLRGLPDTAAVLTNVGGTANAITADTETGIDPAEVQILILPDPPGTNTSTTVTIAIDGGSAESIKSASGANVAIGDIIDGVGTMFFRSGSEWRQFFSSAETGTLDYQGAWAGGTTYTQSQFVTNDGALYFLDEVSSLNEEPGNSSPDPWIVVFDASELVSTNSNLSFVYSYDQYEIVADGSDQSTKINNALTQIGAAGGGKLLLPQGVIGISDTIKIGDGTAGTASTYHDVELIGAGAAPLYSTSSGTTLKWVGTTSASNVMVEVAGPISGAGLSGVYLDADNKAGTCLKILSGLYGKYENILGQNFLSVGLHLTIQSTPSSAVWYSTTNRFDRIFMNGSADGCQGLRLEGTNDNGYQNDPHRNVFSGCQFSSARSLTQSAEPCGAYLGYTDSNTFIECDFSLNNIAEAGVYTDLDALEALNGAALTNGNNYKLKYADNVTGDTYKDNVRREVFYKYDSSSSATRDGFYVLEPADSNGRFLRYQGAALMLDADVRNNFPQNNFFYGCALIQGPSIEDVTSGANDLGRNWFENYTTQDAEEIPSIPGVSGRTDTGIVFGDHVETIRKDVPELVLEQANSCRRTRFLLNAASSTGSNAADHYGTVIIHEERSDDTQSWTETARIVLERNGSLRPNEADQDLGTSSKPWLRTYTERVLLQDRTTAPTAANGMIAQADGAGWDPLGSANGADHSYLVHRVNGVYQPLAPGVWSYKFTVADDAAVNFTPPFPSGHAQICINAGSTSRYVGAYYFVGSGAMVDAYSSGVSTTVTTGALAGTTGTDGHLTFASHTDGKLYIENRTGGARDISVILMTGIA